MPSTSFLSLFSFHTPLLPLKFFCYYPSPSILEQISDLSLLLSKLIRSFLKMLLISWGNVNIKLFKLLCSHYIFAKSSLLGNNFYYTRGTQKVLRYSNSTVDIYFKFLLLFKIFFISIYALLHSCKPVLECYIVVLFRQGLEYILVGYYSIVRGLKTSSLQFFFCLPKKEIVTESNLGYMQDELQVGHLK